MRQSHVRRRLIGLVRVLGIIPARYHDLLARIIAVDDRLPFLFRHRLNRRRSLPSSAARPRSHHSDEQQTCHCFHCSLLHHLCFYPLFNSKLLYHRIFCCQYEKAYQYFVFMRRRAYKIFVLQIFLLPRRPSSPPKRFQEKTTLFIPRFR